MKSQVISFHCVLRDRTGKVLSSTFNRDVLTSPEAGGEMPRGLVEGLENLRKGERRRICLPADRAYGFYDPGLVIEVPRKKLDKAGALRTGYRVLTRMPDGELKVFHVTRVDQSSVTLDGNHPLAGQDLVFEIEATAARDATPEELASPHEAALPVGETSRLLH